MKLEKIVIAIPPVKSGQSFVGVSLPPLGSTRMATVLRQRFPDIPIEIWDGILLGQNELYERTKQLSVNSVLGLSAHTSLNWSNCLDLVNVSPTHYIVVGGIHAEGKRCGQFIVKNHGLDVIQGVGEIPFVEYIEYVLGKRSKEEVQGLIYLDKSNGVKENKRIQYNQTSFPFADYESFLPLSKYAKNFKELFLTGDIGFTMISPEGCKWQEMTKKYCIFCDIGTNYNLHEPEFFGKCIKDHVERYGHYGKVFMVDYADEATGAGIDWWKAVLKNMPKEIKPHEDYGVKIYVKSGKGFLDNYELGKLLWDIGVEDIHVGFEAVTNEDLRSLHKGTLVKYHNQLIDIAKDYEFRIMASFVLGAPTASKNSLEECIHFVDKMKNTLRDKVAVVTGSPLMPLPGAPAWEMLKRKSIEKNEYLELFQDDNPDLYQARKLWYEWFCDKLCSECGGVDEALDYVKGVGNKLNKMGSLPTQKNEYG